MHKSQISNLDNIYFSTLNCLISESVKWFVRADNETGVFVDIDSGDYWRSFQKYQTTHQEGLIVETFLLAGIVSPFPVSI